MEWGKSSLVYKAAGQVQKQSDDIVVCMIDLFNIRTEEEFYKLLATKVLQVSATKLDTILENAGYFLGRFIPNLSFSPDGCRFEIIREAYEDLILQLSMLFNS
ncbi:hypothetical protein ACE01N_09935 [Saccharicrinis sp. FJH2]|uniref:hypothetical protein n=1 Tax=Saccharicrinis sp. FJH65 TaxID=3344659 RepID=UPI0035F49E9C